MLLKVLFFLPVVAFIIYEFWVMANPYTVILGLKRMKQMEKDGNKDYSTNMVLFGVFNLFYTVWCIVGLMSSQWMVFGFLLIWGMTIATPFKKFPAFRSADALMSACLLTFALINAFHLHINLWKVFISQF